MGNKQQTTNNKQQTTNNKQPTTTNNKTNQQPTTNNQQPTTNNQQPTTNNQTTKQPTTNKQQQTTNNKQGLVSALLHHSLRVSSGVEAGQQFSVDEGLGVVDHEEHDNLGDQVSAGLGDDLHVGIHKISDRLHLSLELWIH